MLLLELCEQGRAQGMARFASPEVAKELEPALQSVRRSPLADAKLVGSLTARAAAAQLLSRVRTTRGMQLFMQRWLSAEQGSADRPAAKRQRVL